MAASASDSCTAPTPIASSSSTESCSSSSSSPSSSSSVVRFPSLFLSHGGGPCFFMETKGDSIFASIDKNSAAAAWYRQLATQLGFIDGGKYGKPKSLIVISAHWESTDNENIRITTQAKPSSLYYDYYGFPKETYSLQYPAPGNPSLSARIVDLLKNEKIKAVLDSKRNFDHGVFIPMKLMFPNADIPIVQISLNKHLDPAYHIRLGKALAPLRDEGILIIGSGQTTHDLSFRVTNKQAEQFVNAVNTVITNPELASEDRLKQMIDWEKFPFGRICHPREEHWIPIMSAMGAVNGGIGKPLQKKNPFLFQGMSLQGWIFDDRDAK